MANPVLEAALKSMGLDAPPIVSNASFESRAGALTPGAGLVASTKGSGFLGIEDQPSGASVLNPRTQLGLFHRIRNRSGWARHVTFMPVADREGQTDLWSDENFKMHPVSTEGPRRNIPRHKADVSQITYATRTISGAFGLRLEAIKSLAKAGQSPNELIQKGIAAGVGNVFMDIGINGDTSLPSDSDENKQRSAVNGWFKKLRTASANYTGQADGFAYHNLLFAGMLDSLDEAYQADPGLAFLGPNKMFTRWLTELSGLQPAAAASTHHPSKLGEYGAGILNNTQNVAILGKHCITVPQIGVSQPTLEGYSGVAPTSITNNGDGTLTINVNTLCNSGVDRSSTGADGQRYVIVGCASTGLEERLAVAYSSPNNTVTTATLLGQSSPSTTAADYYVKYADTTTLCLGPPRHMYMVVRNGIRIYTVFYPRDEALEVIVHADVDYVIPDPDAFCLVDTIIAPRFGILGT